MKSDNFFYYLYYFFIVDQVGDGLYIQIIKKSLESYKM